MGLQDRVVNDLKFDAIYLGAIRDRRVDGSRLCRASCCCRFVEGSGSTFSICAPSPPCCRHFASRSRPAPQRTSEFVCVVENRRRSYLRAWEVRGGSCRHTRRTCRSRPASFTRRRHSSESPGTPFAAGGNRGLVGRKGGKSCCVAEPRTKGRMLLPVSMMLVGRGLWRRGFAKEYPGRRLPDLVLTSIGESAGPGLSQQSKDARHDPLLPKLVRGDILNGTIGSASRQPRLSRRGGATSIRRRTTPSNVQKGLISTDPAAGLSPGRDCKSVVGRHYGQAQLWFRFNLEAEACQPN